MFEAEPGSLEEADEARKLAMLYLLMGSVALPRVENQEYIESCLRGGDDVGAVFGYLMQGKLDLTNPAHVAYVEQA